MGELVYKPGHSLAEFAHPSFLKGLFKLDVFSSHSRHVRKYFSHPYIIQILEFPVLFLGAMPQKTPALYSLMNYADLELGTWYPQGGMVKIAEAMEKLAIELGVKFVFNENVEELKVENKNINLIKTNKNNYQADYVIGAGDYRHLDQVLLNKESRNYNTNYWNKRVLAPSSLIFYIGLNKKLQNILHHNLFFDEDFNHHANEIYTNPKWPTNPLFYLCCPSKTDTGVAPENHENLFVLIPVASDLTDSEETREYYFQKVIQRIEKLTGESISNSIVFKRSYCINDFKKDYHSFKGNAYGLANTLKQTALFKPSNINKKVKNLAMAGQLTVPGPGVPPALISGKLAANEILKMSYE